MGIKVLCDNTVLIASLTTFRHKKCRAPFVVFNAGTLSTLIFLREPTRFLCFLRGNRSSIHVAPRSVVGINICTTEQSNKAFKSGSQNIMPVITENICQDTVDKDRK